MSFEGHYQAICRAGHLYEYDVYAKGGETLCHECGSRPVWENLVDDTNGDTEWEIPMDTLIPFRYGVDQLGNHLYNPPSAEETEALTGRKIM